MRGRSERLLGLLGEAAIDVMLVTDLLNVRYLTGFTGSNGLALVGPRTRSFITDFRYVEQAAEEVHASFERRRAARELLAEVAEALPIGELKLGFEDGHLTVRQHAELRERLPERIELVAAGPLVEQLREVKEPEEVATMRIAASVADEAFEAVVGAGLIGRTEREVAVALEQEMVQLGASAPSFETIVAAGPHGALPHHRPRDEAIRRGDLVVIDWGALVDGYHSDCTRTVAAGDPDTDGRDIYELVLEAQLAAVEAVTPGASTQGVDSTARAVIEAAGQGDHFGHGLGHGVGLDIHEGPRLSQRGNGALEPGNVVTVEPGVYLPGRLGVRIEDLVAVTSEGCEILTSVSKDLIVAD
ncbi:MAG TPA: Xaa-Pro peptidase family protein [Solirubrobacteraceae bacterium]|jgi:Xaa-Pro aminopeptidase